MKRVVLLYPSNKLGGSVQPRVELPLGLISVATPLDRAGYEIRIIDERIDERWRETLLEEIRKEPICVGITSMTGPQIQNGLEASRLVRQHGNIPVVWGGIHATLLPEQTLQNESVDIVVQREGEETFFELVQALENGKDLAQVKGIWYKEDGETKSTGQRPLIDLNQQPPLSYHLVDMKQYMVNVFGEGHISFETSRGCPFQCTYCYNSTVYKGRWRGLTVDETIRRIKLLIEEYGVKGILFSDDNFFGNKKRALEILRRIAEENLGVLLSKIDVHVSMLSRLTDSEMRLIRRSGCKMVMMGIESGSPRMLKIMKKRMRIPELIEVNKRLRKFDIMPHYFFMMGFPTETEEDLAKTMSLKMRLSSDNRHAVPRFNIYTPFPGTELFNLSVENGLRVPQKLEDWVSFNYRTVNDSAVWVSERMKKLIRMLHFATLLAEPNNFINSYKKTSLPVALAAAIYYPIARMRVKNLYYQFPIDLKLAELLGVYPKQGG